MMCLKCRLDWQCPASKPSEPSLLREMTKSPALTLAQPKEGFWCAHLLRLPFSWPHARAKAQVFMCHCAGDSASEECCSDRACVHVGIRAVRCIKAAG